jgi:hypothetical protein
MKLRIEVDGTLPALHLFARVANRRGVRIPISVKMLSA